MGDLSREGFLELTRHWPRGQLSRLEHSHDGSALLFALLLLVGLGGVAGIIGIAGQGENAALTGSILGAVGGMTSALIVLLSAPGLVTGVGLLYFKPWARIVGIVLSAISLLGFPVGTAIGIYGLWVLLSRETERLFPSGVPGSDVPRSIG